MKNKRKCKNIYFYIYFLHLNNKKSLRVQFFNVEIFIFMNNYFSNILILLSPITNDNSDNIALHS